MKFFHMPSDKTFYHYIVYYNKLTLFILHMNHLNHDASNVIVNLRELRKFIIVTTRAYYLSERKPH